MTRSKKFLSFILSAAMICTVPSVLPVPGTIAYADGETQSEETLIYENIPVSSLNVSGTLADTAWHTDWWYSEWEDCRYIFLPAMADVSSLTINYEADDTLYLNGTPVKSGELFSMITDDDEFDIKVGDTDCGKLKIMQSDIGCIFLSTKSGSIDALDNNRWLDESGTALMLTPDGKTVYKGEIPKLSAHGNSSWDYSKKKSYNFKLPSKADLFGLGKAKKWVLLANYLDHSMMRNKFTEELCKEAGMECVMDSTFVDLYVDGSYRGTYQLYEKVQIQKNRVNIRDLEEATEDINNKDLKEFPRAVVGADSIFDYIENSYKYYDIPNDPADITGGYLLQMQLWTRYGYKADSGFITSRGQPVEIDGPEYASKAQVEYIRGFIQDMEDAIYSDTGYNSKGKHYSDYIDMDSLIRAYLVQEISKNIDATFTSFYMWKDSDLTGDGKLHFGPAWDFDFAYGCFPAARGNSDGEVGYSGWTAELFAAYFPISGYNDSERPTEGISWIGKLYKNRSFVRDTARIYLRDFYPALDHLAGKDAYIFDMATQISGSAEMNNARWHTYGGAKYCVFGSSSGKDFMESVGLVRTYAQLRKDWLKTYWTPFTAINGDVNCDDKFDIADAVLLQKKVLASSENVPADYEAADFTEDGIIDVFDLILMKQKLVTDAEK